MKKEFKKKLKEFGILTVYLFGSTATGMKSRLSDIDIGVVLDKALSGEKPETYTTSSTGYLQKYTRLQSWTLSFCRKLL